MAHELIISVVRLPGIDLEDFCRSVSEKGKPAGISTESRQNDQFITISFRGPYPQIVAYTAAIRHWVEIYYRQIDSILDDWYWKND